MAAEFDALPGAPDPGALSRHEAVTLEIGTTILMAALAAGTQLGGWPLWSVAVAIVGGVAWTVLYSEATVQAMRWRSGSPLFLWLSSEPQPAPSPRHEQAPA